MDELEYKIAKEELLMSQVTTLTQTFIKEIGSKYHPPVKVFYKMLEEFMTETYDNYNKCYEKDENGKKRN